MSALIAIVGRPNVGKSALFNRIVGRRIAIVHDEPGVTRDRISAEAEWLGRPFTLVDTGGIGLLRGQKSDDLITRAALAQVEIAIEAACAIIFVVNVQEGIVPLDREVAARLRQSGKPILVAVNKVDSFKAEPSVDEFSALGFAQVFPVSAIHGEGIGPLMNAALAHVPEDPAESAATSMEEQRAEARESGSRRRMARRQPRPAAEQAAGAPEAAGGAADHMEKASGPLKIAVVGRPNVGKSSIINTLTKSERVIVSPIPGTTRDAVDVPFEVVTDGVHQQYILIDTAGVRQERRVDNSIEFYSVKRTDDSIDRCDIAVFVIDAEVGVTSQDKKVAGKIFDARKACVLVVNKWDLVMPDLNAARAETGNKRRERGPGEERKPATLAEFGSWVQEQLFFLDFAPVIFTSAATGFHLDRLLESIRDIAAQLKQTVPTSILNRALNDAIERRQPVSASGSRLKFFYATQVRRAPPVFLLFVNREELFSPAYTKYLATELRRAFGYEGCPVILVPRARPKTIEPKRKYNKPDGTERNPGARRAARSTGGGARGRKSNRRSAGRP